MLFENDINRINEKIKIKKANNDNTKIFLEFSFYIPIDLIENIIDKNMVCFKIDNSDKFITVNEILEIEKTLDLFVNDIKNSNLSPYEKYIAVYSMVKSFKEYNYYNNSREDDIEFPYGSRSVYFTLFNDYMVCVGFTMLLTNLLGRVGINAIEFSSKLKDDSSYKHSKCCVNIVDLKYNINGYFINDVTNDNSVKENDFFDNYYIHFPLNYSEKNVDDSYLLNVFKYDNEFLREFLLDSIYNYNFIKQLEPELFLKAERRLFESFIRKEMKNYSYYLMYGVDLTDFNILNKISKLDFNLFVNFRDYVVNDDEFLNELRRKFVEKSSGFIRPNKLYLAILNVKKFINGDNNSLKNINSTMIEVNKYRILYMNNVLKNIIKNFKNKIMLKRGIEEESKKI